MQCLNKHGVVYYSVLIGVGLLCTVLIGVGLLCTVLIGVGLLCTVLIGVGSIIHYNAMS
jgi:hypothetical protein